MNVGPGTGNFESYESWREAAACRDSEPEIFFPTGTTGPALEQIANAKAICSTCVVKQACLEYAVTTNQDDGVWGGTSEDERRQIRRKYLAAKRRGRDIAI